MCPHPVHGLFISHHQQGRKPQNETHTPANGRTEKRPQRPGQSHHKAQFAACPATLRLEQPTNGEPASVLIQYEELVKTSKSGGKNDTLAVRSEPTSFGASGFISYPVGSQLVEHRCESYASEEFPPTPRVKGDSIPLSPALRDSNHDASECASTDETRYILNGAYLDVSKPEGHYVVAADGRQLFSSNSFTLDLPESLVIPTHNSLGGKNSTRMVSGS